jgi:hypothetical protein
VIKSLLPVFFSTPKTRPQISQLLMWKKKLHVSDGRQTLRSRLTILLLQQDRVHGDQLHYPLLFSIILTTSCQTGGFVRLPRWSTPTVISLKLPGSHMPLEPSVQCQAAPHLFYRAAEVALGVSFNAQSQTPDIPGASSRAAFVATHNFLTGPIPGYTLVERIYGRAFGLLQHPSSKFPTIRLTSRLPSVFRVICPHHHPLSTKCSQGCPQNGTSIPFPFNLSQVNAHLPPNHIKKTPHQGFCRSEVHVLCGFDLFEKF